MGYRRMSACWPGQCTALIWEFMHEADWEKGGVVLLKCQPITLYVAHYFRLDHIVHVTLDVKCAIQHHKSIHGMTVHSTLDHHTPAVPLVLFSKVDVAITLTCAMSHPEPSINIWETNPGLVGKIWNPVPDCWDVNQWSLGAHRCLFRMGPRYGRRACSVNHLRRLRMVCVDIRALWHPGVSATVLADGLHRSHRCSRRIYQSYGGVVLGGPNYVDISTWSQTLVGDVSTT